MDGLRYGSPLPCRPEAPAVVHFLAQHEAQAVMAGQVVGGGGGAALLQIGGRGAEHAAVRVRQRQGHQAGILRPAIAKCRVHRLAVDIGRAVGQVQAQIHACVLALELVQPGHEHVAAQVGGGGQLQRAAQSGLAASQLVAHLAQAGQRGAAVLQKQLALLREPQAARGAHEQGHAQLCLQPLERCAGRSRRQVQGTRRGREAAAVCGAHEDIQVLQAFHGHSPGFDFQKLFEA